MQRKIKKVLFIDSEPSLIEQQRKKLSYKELEDNFYSSSNLAEAFEFIEKQIIEKNKKLHYIILDEKLAGKELSYSLEKLWGLKNFLQKPDIIIIADENNIFLRNRIMQYPFVSAYIIKPIPSDYIEFLITGEVG